KARWDDFGSQWYRTPLEKLCASYADDPELTFVGRIFCRTTLVHILTNRLRVQRALHEDPGIVQEIVRRPLFVVGLPRTGTTFLFNLLAQDPACRPLMYWETMSPAPPPRPETYATDPRIAQARRQVRLLKRALPEFNGIHEFNADAPEECTGLLMNAFLSPVFGGLVPLYRQWLDEVSDADVEAAYADYRTQLQVLQRYVKGSHWILKCPTHVFAIRELLATFPDAALVQTHRDVSQCIPSLCSLHHVYQQLCYRNFDRREAGKLVAGIVEQQLNRGMRSRDRADAQGRHVLDIHYTETVRDPVATVQKVYAHFGYDFTPEFEARLKKYLAEDKHPKGPRHQYTLEEFGLSPEDLQQRFGAYAERFHVAPDAKTPK
ncbi:MAG: sulfotransferase, partial [Planctomycetaceae bacterium]|nr:sulfotransferase [Planctomycetaceae bacterium]